MSTFFSKEHEWARIEGDVATAGISEHAAHELGDVTFVELPAVGTKVRQFEVMASIESVKAASDIYAPLSGTVVEVNSALEDAPEMVNELAEQSAWMVKIKIDNPAESDALMNADQYQAYLAGL